MFGLMVEIFFAMGSNVAHFVYLTAAVFRRGAGAAL